MDPPLPGVEELDVAGWGCPISFGMATAPATATTTTAAATAGTQAGNSESSVRVPDRRVAASGFGPLAIIEKVFRPGTAEPAGRRSVLPSPHLDDPPWRYIGEGREAEPQSIGDVSRVQPDP